MRGRQASGYLAYLADQPRAGLRMSPSRRDLTRADLSREFDGAFCRWFLAFLRDDLDVVLENVRGMPPSGGVFAAMEYLTLRSATCSPSSAAFDANTPSWIEFYARHGGDSSIGESLPGRLSSAGFRIRSLMCVGGMAIPYRWWEWWGRLFVTSGRHLSRLALLALMSGTTCSASGRCFPNQPTRCSFTHPYSCR